MAIVLIVDWHAPAAIYHVIQQALPGLAVEYVQHPVCEVECVETAAEYVEDVDYWPVPLPGKPGIAASKPSHAPGGI